MLRKLIEIFSSIATMISVWFIIILVLTLSTTFYEKQIDKHSIGSEHYISQSDLIKTYNSIIKKSVTGFKSKDEIVTMYLDYESINNLEFTKNEALHMYDVKLLYNIGYIFVSLSTLIFLYLIFYKRDNKIYLLKKYTETYTLVSIFLAILLILIFLNFDTVFYYFHKLLFTNDNWLFPSDSLLIIMLPQEFFMDIAIISILCCIVISVLFILTTKLIYIRNKYEKGKDSSNTRRWSR